MEQFSSIVNKFTTFCNSEHYSFIILGVLVIKITITTSYNFSKYVAIYSRGKQRRMVRF